MNRFNYGSMSEWELNQQAAILEFKVGTKARTIGFQVCAPDGAELYVSDNLEMEGEHIFAASTGLFIIEMTVVSDTFIRIAAGTHVMVKMAARDMQVTAHYDEKFTSTEMRRSQNPEFDRMLMIVKHNERQFLAKLNGMQDQLDAGQRLIEAPAIIVAPPALTGAKAEVAGKGLDGVEQPAGDGTGDAGKPKADPPKADKLRKSD